MSKPDVKSTTPTNERDLWGTPRELVHGAVEFLYPQGCVGLDVCATHKNAKAENFITPDENALMVSWKKRLPEGTCAWCNPPYSGDNKMEFLKKAIDESRRGVPTVMLLPASTAQQWFSFAVEHANKVVFITDGRISFLHPETNEKINGNTGGSVLFLFDVHQYERTTSYVARDWILNRGRALLYGSN